MNFDFRVRRSTEDRAAYDRETAAYIESVALRHDDSDPLVRLFGWDSFADGGLTAPVSIDSDLRNITLTLRPANARSAAGVTPPFDVIPDVRCEFGDVVFFEFANDWGASYWLQATDSDGEPGPVYDRCELDTLDDLITAASQRLAGPARSVLLRFDNDAVLGVVFGRFEMRVIEHGETGIELPFFTKERALEAVARLREKA